MYVLALVIPIIFIDCPTDPPSYFSRANLNRSIWPGTALWPTPPCCKARAHNNYPWYYCSSRNPGLEFFSFFFLQLIAQRQARFLISGDTVFTEVGNKTGIKYRNDFTKYKSFLVKHGSTPAIRQLVDTLNANVLQIDTGDTRGCMSGSATVPHEDDEEDLVAQALINPGATISFVRCQPFTDILVFRFRGGRPSH